MYANWKARNTARASPDARLTDNYFFRPWRGILSPFMSSDCYTVLLSDNVSKIIASCTPQAEVPKLPLEPPTPPPSRHALRVAHRQKRKEERVLELETILHDAEDSGFLLVFTDGSSDTIHGVGRLGGYGVYSENGVSLSEHMLLGMEQTNNRAELMAALRALQLHPVGKIAMCFDSEYLPGTFIVRQRHFSRVFSTFHWMCPNIVPWVGGGLYVYFLKSV